MHAAEIVEGDPERNRRAMIRRPRSSRRVSRPLSLFSGSRYNGSVKLPHAAALALTGWYLMTPPVTQTLAGLMRYDKAPLQDWQIQGTFDGKIECDRALTDYVSDPNNNAFYRAETDAVRRKYLAQEKIVAECIATDDPRLKKK